MNEEDYLKQLAKNVQMVIDHERSCDTCMKFFLTYGWVTVHINTLEGVERTTQDVLECLRRHYTKREEYEKLASLSRITTVRSRQSPEEFKAIVLHAMTILSFEENCEVCWLALEADEMIPFYGFDSLGIHMDFISFITVLSNHFHDTGRHDRCILLVSLLRELEQDFPEGKYRNR